MTIEEKRNLISENLNLNSSTAAIAVEMLEKQREFLVAIAKNNYEIGGYETVGEILEIIDIYATYIFGNGLSEENQIALWDDMRDKVLALKGGEQE